MARLLLSSFSLSAVPGGVGSLEGANVGVLSEGVRRCRFKYDVDRGSSGRLEEGGGTRDWPAVPYDDRRLTAGD